MTPVDVGAAEGLTIEAKGATSPHHPEQTKRPGFMRPLLSFDRDRDRPASARAANIADVIACFVFPESHR